MKQCAFEVRNQCSALREKTCIGCTFRKSKEELEMGRKQAMDRILHLPNIKKTRIIHKYHKEWR